MKAVFLFAFLLFLTRCSSLPFPSGKWEKKDIQGKDIIVFVPGLYGSALADAENGDRIFQTLGQALWGTIPLALHGDVLGVPGARNLKPDGILQGVTVIPFLYAADAYGGSIAYLQKNLKAGVTIIPFAYDWRDDDVLAAQALGREVRALKEAGARRIALVGHSLGGALISFYLRYGEQGLENTVENWQGLEFVDLAVIAGVPFRGTMAAFRDLLQGTKVGLAKTPLSAVSLGSFPSYYQFLPPPEDKRILKEDLSDLSTAVYKVENAEKWKLGLFSDTEGLTTPLLLERKKYTEKYLQRGLRFTSLMRANLRTMPKKHIPYLAITGSGQETSDRAVWVDGEWIFDAKRLSKIKPDMQFSFLSDGDGLVSIASSLPPQAFVKALRVEQATFPVPHRGMFTEKSVQEKVTQFLTKHGF